MPKPDFSKEIHEIATRFGPKASTVAKVGALSPRELEALTNAYVEEVGQSPAYRRLLPAMDLAAPYLINVLNRKDAFTVNANADFLKRHPARVRSYTWNSAYIKN